LVDDYDFQAYKAAGFGKIGDDQAGAKAATTGLRPPEGVNWLSYFLNVGKISPVPKDLPFGQFPEGVTRLGGTFAVEGDAIKFAWADRIPGDHPEVSSVMETFGV